MVRAGWSGPRLSASKLSHSASMTGPSATSQPIATKMSAISSEPVVIGCRAPAATRSVGQGDVDGLLDQHPLLVLGLEHRLPRGERLVDRAARLADPLAGLLARLRRQRTDLAVGQRQRRPVTRVLEPHLLELGEVGGAGDRGQGRVAHRLDLLRLERGDLDGVVIGVRSRHVCLPGERVCGPSVGTRPARRRTGYRRGLAGPTLLAVPLRRPLAQLARFAWLEALSCVFAAAIFAGLLVAVRRAAARGDVRLPAGVVRRRHARLLGGRPRDLARGARDPGLPPARARPGAVQGAGRARGATRATRSPRSRASRSSRASCTPRSAPTSARPGAGSTCA